MKLLEPILEAKNRDSVKDILKKHFFQYFVSIALNYVLGLLKISKMRRSRTVETPVEISSGLVFYGKPHSGVVKMLFGAPNKDMGGFMKRLKCAKNALD